MSFVSTFPKSLSNLTLCRLSEVMTELNEERDKNARESSTPEQMALMAASMETREVCIYVGRGYISVNIFKCWKDNLTRRFGGQLTVSDEPPINHCAILVVDEFVQCYHVEEWLKGHEPSMGSVIVSYRWCIECLKQKVLLPVEDFIVWKY
jgi:hypothetical protein